MDNNWQIFNRGFGNNGYGDDGNYCDFYRGGGYGSIKVDSDEKYSASGTGGAVDCNLFYIGGYGHPYPNKGDGSGSGEAYGESWSHGSGYGNGRSSDYYAAGYGAVNQDEFCEDGHGDGGIYNSECIPDEILYLLDEKARAVPARVSVEMKGAANESGQSR